MKKTNIKLNLAVFGDDFDVELLDVQMGLLDTSKHIKNEIIPHRPQLRWKETSWNYCTDSIETLFLTDVTDVFVSSIENKVDVLTEFTNNFKIEIKIFIIFEVLMGEMPALFFNRNFLDIVNNLNAEIDIDSYFID